MTSLAQQLQSLQNERLSHPNVQLSYLFSPREATKLRNEDIYAYASNAFRSLLAKQPKLATIQEVLISENSQKCDRSVLTTEENEKLNDTLAHAARLIGPFVLDRDCAYFIEWLVRRFRIHEFNVKTVLSLFLPFHETPQFAQMLQLLRIEQSPEFKCLLPVKKSLQMLPRPTLVQYMRESPEFKTFVSTLLPVAIKRKTHHRSLLSFWTAAVVAYIGAGDSVGQEDLGVFLPGVYAAIRAKTVTELQLAGYIVLVHLLGKTVLAPEALQDVVELVAAKISTAPNDNEVIANHEAAITTIVSICQRQEELSELREATFVALASRKNLVPALVHLAESHHIVAFWRPFFARLVQMPDQTSILEDLLSQCVVNAAIRSQICFSIAQTILAYYAARDQLEDQEPLISILSQVRQLDPASFASALAASPSSPTLSRVLTLTLAGADGLAAVTLGGRDAEETIRQATFAQLLESPVGRAKEDFILLLSDTSPSVSGLLDAPALGKMQAVLSDAEIVDASLATCLLDATSRATITNHVKFLTSLVGQENRILQGLWPKLGLTKSNKRTAAAIWSTLLSSPLGKSHLLKNVALPEEPTSRSNWEISKILAANVWSSPEQVAWIEFLKSTASDSCLSCLVLSALMAASKKTFKLPAQLIASISASASWVETRTNIVVDSAPSQEILDACYSKSRAPKTISKIHACLLLLSVSTFSPPKDAAWNWLQSADRPDVELFRTAITSVYKAAHTTTNMDLATPVFQACFGRLLGEDCFSFLASEWLRTDGLRLPALQDTITLLDSLIKSNKHTDLQLLLPSLFAVFSNGTRQEKEVALGLCDRISTLLAPDSSLYGSIALYGTKTANLAPIPEGDLKAYLAEIKVQASTLLGPDGLASFNASIGSSLESKKKGRRLASTIYHGMMSHLNATTNTDIIVALSEAFDQFQQEGMFDSLSPILKPAALQSLISSLADTQKDILLGTVLRAFEYTSASELQNPRQETYTAYTMLLKSDSDISKAALAILPGSVFQKLSAKQKLDIINLLLDLFPTRSAKDCLYQLQPESTCVISLLLAFSASLRGSSAKGATPKRQKLSSEQDVAAVALRVLDFFETAHMSHLNAIPSTVSAMLDLLDVVVDRSDQLGAKTLDLKRSILAALWTIMSGEKTESPEWNNVKITPILEIVKTSSSPQLTNQGLLLLSEFTKIVPQLVVLHMVPILAFMGASVFQRDDPSSQRVIEAIMGGIVPVLVDSHRRATQSTAEFMQALAPLIKTFTDVVVHVPPHRRASLLVQLVKSIGAQDSLSPVLLNVLDPSFDSKSSINGRDLAVSVCAHMATRDKLHALSQLAEAVRKSNTSSDSPKIARIMAFLLQNLESPALAAKIDSAHAKGVQTFDTTLSSILKTMVMARSQTTDKRHCTTIIGACTRLLSSTMFSQSVLWLFSLSQDEASLEAFALLRQKCTRLSPRQREELQPAIHAAYARAVDFASSKKALVESEVLQTSTQLAQGALPTEHDALAQIFESVLAYSTDSVDALDLLAVVELKLGPRIMSSAPKLIALTRSTLNKDDSAKATRCLQVLQNLTSALASLSAPFLPDILPIAFSSPPSVAPGKMESFRRRVVENVSIKSLHAALAKLWPREEASEDLHLVEMLRDSLNDNSKADLPAVYKRTFHLLLQALDATDKTTNAAARQAYLAMALQCSEKVFNPLFQQTVDWAFGDQGNNARRVTVLRLSEEMGQELQLFFLPFFKHLLIHIVSLFDNFAKGQEKDATLFEAVLQLLVTVFSFDDSEYWTRAKLEQLSNGLSEQFDFLVQNGDQAVSLSHRAALVAMVKLDAADEAFIKSINGHLLRATRSHPELALKALDALWSDAGEVMMSFVAETVPFLVECLDDEDAHVQEAAKTLVASIEGSIGESLDAYLA